MAEQTQFQTQEGNQSIDQQPVLSTIQQNKPDDQLQQQQGQVQQNDVGGQDKTIPPGQVNPAPQAGNFVLPQTSPLLAAQLLQLLPKSQNAAGGNGMDTSINLLNTLGNPHSLGLQQFMQSLQGFQALDPSKLNALNAAAMAQFESNRKRKRRKKSAQQIQVLREYFAVNPKPNKAAAHKLANMVQLSYQEVTRWFRNERHKTKKEQAWQRTGAQQVANGALTSMPNSFATGLPNLDSAGAAAAAAAAVAAASAAAVDAAGGPKDDDEEDIQRKKMQKISDGVSNLQNQGMNKQLGHRVQQVGNQVQQSFNQMQAAVQPHNALQMHQQLSQQSQPGSNNVAAIAAAVIAAAAASVNNGQGGNQQNQQNNQQQQQSQQPQQTQPQQTQPQSNQQYPMTTPSIAGLPPASNPSSVAAAAVAAAAAAASAAASAAAASNQDNNPLQAPTTLGRPQNLGVPVGDNEGPKDVGEGAASASQVLSSLSQS